MTKGKINVLTLLPFFLVLFYGNNLQAQIEVVPLEEEYEVFYFDSISPNVSNVIEERTIPDSLLKQLQRDEAFWYANAEIKKKEAEDKSQSLSLGWMKKEWIRSVLWLLMIGLFVGIIIWFLSTLNIRLFRKSSPLINTSSEEMIQEDIFSISYPTEINKAISANNYRQAIRLYYLQSLSLLSQKKWIDYKQDLTNSDYVNQLMKTPLFKDFFRLTKNFEYAWYGKFEITQTVFNLVQKDFETFNKQLQS